MGWENLQSLSITDTCSNENLRKSRAEYRIALGQVENIKKYIEERQCGTLNESTSSQSLVCGKIKEFLKEQEGFVQKYDQCRHTLYQSNELQEIQEVDRVVSVPYEEPKMEFITTDINANHNIDIAYIDSDFSEPSKDPTVTNIEGQKICWFEIWKWGTSDKIVPVRLWDIIGMQFGTYRWWYYDNNGLIYMDQILWFENKEQAKKMNPQETFVYMRSGMYPWNSSKDGEVMHHVPDPSLYFALKTYAPWYRKWKITREANNNRNVEIIFHGCYGFGDPIPNF